MGRILMTWELGAGRGHLAPMLSLATRLRDAGHHVELAVRDPGDARPFLEQAGLRFHAAPIPTPLGGSPALSSYPQILKQLEFADADTLHARLRAWHVVFGKVRPELLVCDHSPTALLAARAEGIKAIVTGTGFFVPPDISPLPELRPWQPGDPQQLANDETAVLAVMNSALAKFPAAPLQRLAQLFAVDAQALFTLRELDNYSAHRQADYWGPVPAGPGAAPEWPAGDGKRIFAYLRRFDTLPALLASLRDSGQPTLIYLPQQPRELISRFEGGNLHFSTVPLDMDAVTRQCDLAVLHAGHGVTAALLLAGKPMLLLPLHLEMLLTARAVTRLGAGLAAPELKPAGMQRKLMRLLQEPAFGAAARDFAERYAGLDVKAIPSRFAALVEHVLGQ
ncbi:MAG TPA: nucleotide disphospho-sugar-binding domain-containing protein [Gammaproteobacteria bacterium]|nr:nucleotide disphospho-sugar-binding domain-containing protein [Gammaproteobacteria bacterium]